jgi:pimeloyl-ACP methyl ester carboxylesterase
MNSTLIREPLTVAFEEKSPFKETYGGADVVVLDGQHLHLGEKRRIVLLFMHPTGVMNHLPLSVALARAGTPVLTVASRYPHNDTALIMEKVALDMGRWVRYAIERLGYQGVVLAGWSGGGSLSLFYQAQAEAPSIEATPAGDPVDLVGAGLIPAVGVMQLAAHVSRSGTLAEWIDPAIGDELAPYKRNADFDIYGDPPAAAAPFSAAFQNAYRAAQRARIARIDAFVDDKLAWLRAKGRANDEHSFVVHGTMADLRWLDPAIDPNDRVPGRCYMGDPQVVNMSPAHLARFTSLRSWLSQWSSRSRAHGPDCAATISVPALVIENSADDACTPSHAARIVAGFKRVTPAFHRIAGANHYYLGQREKAAEAIGIMQDWLRTQGWAH